MINLQFGKFSLTINFPRWLGVLALGAAIYAASVPNKFSDGDTLSAEKLNANFEAHNTAIDAASPPGAIVAFGGTTAPTGWLLCNGATVSRTSYATLFAAIGTNFGVGDGGTTFHLPDLRGRFLRGRDGTTGRDPDAAGRTASNSGGNSGDAVGSLQTDAFQGHWHDIWVNVSGTAGASGNDIRAQNAAANNIVRSPVTDGVNGTPRTTSETRPVNIYVNYIIKQ